jgi:hypothetical protein
MDERREFNTLDQATQEMLDRALDRVIDGTDGKIRLVPGYKLKLYKAILRSLEYIDRIIERIPRPIDLSISHFVSDPYIRAFFPTLDGLKKVFSKSDELHDYFTEDEHANDAESCALLCMSKEEETILGMELEGDYLVKDVKQTRVTFAAHRIYAPAETEPNARRELKCCLFEGLVTNARDEICERREKRGQLQLEQQMLSSRLRGRGRDINDINEDSELGKIVNNHAKRQSQTHQLKEVETALNRIGYVTPEVCLHLVNSVLSQPEDFVSLKNISIRLDKSGIKRVGEEKTTQSVCDLHLSEVQIKGLNPRVVTLAKIRRDELQTLKPSSVISITKPIEI